MATRISIRLAGPEDDELLRRLAALDSAPVPTGRALLAEQANEAVAAISLGTGAVVADPFRPSAPAADLLRLRRYQLLRQGGDVGPARSVLRRMLPAH
jgi:hypothetical protein